MHLGYFSGISLASVQPTKQQYYYTSRVILLWYIVILHWSTLLILLWRKISSLNTWEIIDILVIITLFSTFDSFREKVSFSIVKAWNGNIFVQITFSEYSCLVVNLLRHHIQIVLIIHLSFFFFSDSRYNKNVAARHTAPIHVDSACDLPAIFLLRFGTKYIKIRISATQCRFCQTGPSVWKRNKNYHCLS